MRASFFAVLALVAVAVAAPTNGAGADKATTDAGILGRCPDQDNCLYRCFLGCRENPTCERRCSSQCQCHW
ncbi:hypothetical protein BC828DRAFT_405511 [Blastocladiella britannica]|nr:hypothetical protein BC828DRAFT_405511 [Blastocladiella britannica]